MLDVQVGRLSDQVAAKEKSRGDLPVLEVGDGFGARERCVLAYRHRKAEPARVRAFGGSRQDQVFVHVRKPFVKKGEVAPAGFDESRHLVQLRQPDRRLHVGDLQVVADVRIGVLVVVAERQLADLPTESLSTGIGLSWIAPAIAAPVAVGVDQHLEQPSVLEHAPALAHGHVVSRVEADGRQVAERPDRPALVSRPQRVAAVLDQPELVALCKGGHGIQVEWIAERVGHHDGRGALAQRILQPGDVDVVGGHCDVHEDRDQAILDDRVQRGRESGRDGDHLIAGLEGCPAAPLARPLVQLGRREGGQSQQVGRRAGVDQVSVPASEELREALLELVREAACGQPEVEARVDEVHDLAIVEDAARVGDRALAGNELSLWKGGAVILPHQLQDLETEG